MFKETKKIMKFIFNQLEEDMDKANKKNIYEEFNDKKENSEVQKNIERIKNNLTINSNRRYYIFIF